jgi:predicted lysophospholipase L1 biosynthesis ABC-type transport system permease subunit
MFAILRVREVLSMIESHELRTIFLLGLGVVAIVAIATGAAVGSLVHWIRAAVAPRPAPRASREARPATGETARPLHDREAA